ncbi:MAG: hypothetical protein JO323_12920 [Acidobacteriia bacterium]|nr:hypothetical protein [Terriglobia bacterium]
MRCILFLLTAAFLAEAQIGYPGGGYPLPGQTPYPGGTPYPGSPYPGRYPGGNRYPTGTPAPTGGGKQKPAPDQPLPSFHGKLRQMDAKSLTLELDDYRTLDFKIISRTKYFKKGTEVKTPDFKPGDQLTVEGPEDGQGLLTAINVYWEKAAGAAESADEKQQSGVTDTWKDKPAESGTTRTIAAPPDEDDPGPPTLKRGKPAARPSESSSTAEQRPSQNNAPPETSKTATPKTEPPRQVAGNLPPNTVPLPPNTVPLPPSTTAAAPANPPAPAPATQPNARPNLVGLPESSVSLPRPAPQEDLRPPAEPADDQTPLGVSPQEPLIRRATEAALDFTESLPNYVCQEVISRYESTEKPISWRPVDVVSTDVVYENGKEDYRNITINGKASTRNVAEQSGAWSSGEFGSLLIDLFSPATAADFHYRRDGRAGGVDAKIYDFEVQRENSHWTLHFGAQTYAPAYHGSTWIDPKTGRVLRIEIEAVTLPGQFPTDHVESATDYQYVRLGGTQQYLLPVHSEVLSCQRGTPYCSKNSIDFRNYHKYAGESQIQFGDVKDTK